MLNQTFELRPIQSGDEGFMWEMLCASVFVPDGERRPTMDELHAYPEITHYVTDWGTSHDFGYIAIETSGGQPIGAVWLRRFDAAHAGYGYVNDDTPEVCTLAVVSEWRGSRVGTALLQSILTYADAHYVTVSLSCDPRNPALRLYQRHGFHKVGESGTSDTLLRTR